MHTASFCASITYFAQKNVNIVDCAAARTLSCCAVLFQRMVPESRATSGFCPMSKYKVVLLGEHSVGKTSVAASFMRQPFENVYSPTIGIDFSARNIYLDDASIRLQLWDTGLSFMDKSP